MRKTPGKWRRGSILIGAISCRGDVGADFRMKILEGLREEASAAPARHKVDG